MTKIILKCGSCNIELIHERSTFPQAGIMSEAINTIMTHKCEEHLYCMCEKPQRVAISRLDENGIETDVEAWCSECDKWLPLENEDEEALH